MGKLDSLVDSVNRYLVAKELPPMPKAETEACGSIESLLLSAMRCVWTIQDKSYRDRLSVEIAQALKKFMGGKAMEEVLDKARAALDAEEAKRAEEEKKAELSRRKADPNYVPSFDELMGS